MRTAILAGLLLFYCVPAQAEPSPRVATLSTLFGGVLPAVMIARDRAWVPTLTTQVPLRLCAGTHCDAVARVERCTVPRCPGTGALAIAEHSVADVSDYPMDRDGFARERTLLAGEPSLAGIVSALAEHPDGTPPPPMHYDMEWLDRSFLGWRVEAAGAASVGFLVPDGATVLGGEARIALRYTWQPDGSDDDFVAVMLGNSIGPEVTLRGLALQSANGSGAFAVGLDLAASYMARRWSVRVPAVYSPLVPELGIVFREGFAPAFYAGWSLPVTLLVDPRIAVELRLTGLVVDDWVPGDDVAFIGLLTAGIVVR